jgi:hypothetical protein
MYKTTIKYLLLTAIFSTQFSLNTFAMDPDKDPSRQGKSTKKKKDVTEDPKLPYDLEGQKILNQQPYDPNNNPQLHTIPKEQLKKKKSDNQ